MQLTMGANAKSGANGAASPALDWRTALPVMLHTHTHLPTHSLHDTAMTLTVYHTVEALLKVKLL